MGRSRRSVLAAVGSATLVGCAGCVSGSDSTPSGSVVVDNRTDQRRTGTVELSPDATTAVATTANTSREWTRETTFEVEANERSVEPDYITREGYVRVRVTLDSGATAAANVRPYPRSDDRTRANGGHVVVNIFAADWLVISQVHDE